MSELGVSAQLEARDALHYMGFDERSMGLHPEVARYYRTAVTSILEFGLDTVHPTVTDAEADAAKEIRNGERCER